MRRTRSSLMLPAVLVAVWITKVLDPVTLGASLAALLTGGILAVGVYVAVLALMRAPERFVEVSWDGENEASYRVEIQIDAYDRTRLLEDLARTFSEAGINIIGASCTTSHPMVKNRFVVEVGDTEQLRQTIVRLRNVDSVFDAYRVTQ